MNYSRDIDSYSHNNRIGMIMCCVCAFVLNIDSTTVNIALPDIEKSFHPSLSVLQWVVDAYILVLASVMVMSGSLGDRFGRKKVLWIGLTIFAVSSLLCSLADNVHVLIFFRMIQGYGGSFLTPCALPLLSSLFSDQKLRAKAISLWGMSVGIGMASGPVIGGLLVETLGWRSVFWINVPICLGIILAGHRFLPESRSEKIVSADILGQIWIFIALLGITYTIIDLPHAEDYFHLLLPLIIAIMAFVLFIVQENRVIAPLIDLRFFRSIPISAGILISIVVMAAAGGGLFINTMYLQDFLGESAIMAGLYIVPLAIMTAICARMSAKLLDRAGFMAPIAFSGVCLIIAAGLFIVVAYIGPSLLLFLAFIFLGAAIGSISTPVNTILIMSIPQEKGGIAGALSSAGRQLGQGLGVAILGAIFAAGLQGHTLFEAYTHAVVPVWFICGLCGLCVIFLARIATTDKAKRSAVKLAEYYRS